MAFADQTVKAFQTAYDNAIYPALSESSVFSIPLMISRLQQTNGANKVKFYNIKSSTATEGRLDGLNKDNEGTAGNITDHETEVKYYYADRRVYKDEISSTSLDIAGDFVRSFIRAVDRKINLAFLKSIDDATGVRETGDVTKTPDLQIEEYIEACELATIRVENRPEFKPEAVLVMNSKDYANLYRAVKKTSSDFMMHNERGMFYTAKVVTFEDDVVPSGTTYVIPWGTTGFGYHQEVNASSKYSDLFDGLYCWANKTGGTVVIDPKAITKITSKAIA